MDSEDYLASFRQEWRRELESSRSQRETSKNQGQGQPQTPSESQKSQDGISIEVETKAAELFNQGVDLEQNGQLYESIKYYKKAISLVPDIELRLHQNIHERDDYLPSDDENEEGVSDQCHISDLITRFESQLSINQPFCQAKFPQDDPHLSCLPAEMLDKILCWIIGNQLDFESLERVASVCRGFYLLCRKPDIWRRACIRLWGINTELGTFNSWREMFIWRPRPRFNGCYISKTTYFRSGESSFQDLSYQPWHFISYYRYLRFFPKGFVLMLTSSEEPQSVVGHLKNFDTKYPQVLMGHFGIHGNSLTMLFRNTSGKVKNRLRGRYKGQGTTDVSDTTFQMEMEIKTVRGRPHWQLVWRCYSIVSSFNSGSHTTSVVNVADQATFPHLCFSKVKSYSAESHDSF